MSQILSIRNRREEGARSMPLFPEPEGAQRRAQKVQALSREMRNEHEREYHNPFEVHRSVRFHVGA
ncbi:MAG TPA: hypothetical protein VKT22_15880 [Steroidobacteraceae bacterium]|nr:hypothetical protein [Steroidobacteraceae bacterium]